MSPPPLISIVVTAYNRERFLAATLESIRAQTLADWECVVVDDGSADQTAAIAQKTAGLDPRIRLVSQENAGPAAARNRGLRELSPGSTYITFMDGDDVWIPTALETLVAELERFPKAIGAHGLADNVDEHGQPLEESFTDLGRTRLAYEKGGAMPTEPTEPTSFGLVAWTNRVYPPGVLLTRRSFLEKAGPFDGSFGRVDDWDMIVRLARYGDFCFINKVIISYRRHGGNISAEGSVSTALRQMHYKMFFSPENTPTQKRILRSGWRSLQILHARQKWRMVKEKLAHFQLKQAVTILAGMYVQLHRYLRGYPTRDGI